MTTPQPDATTDPILAHCQMLHDCAAGIEGNLVVSVFYASPQGETDKPGSVTHHAVGDAERMADTIAAHLDTPGANVYVGLQVMRRGLERGRRGSESDVVAILGLVADMDNDTGKAGGTTGAGDLPYPPSYVLETSHGNGQPAWLFDRPLSVDEAKPLAAALRRATGSDAGTADVVHVFRIPGTLNWPNAKKLSRGRSPDPATVTVVQEWDGTLVNVEEFRAALAPWAVAATAATTQHVGALPEHVDVDDEIAAMLQADGQPDRSAHAARLIEKLAYRGHSIEQCVMLILACDGAWTERYANEDVMRKDVARLWAKFGGDHKQMAERGAQIAERLLGRVKQTESAPLPAPAPDPDAIHATPFEWKDPAKLPRMETLYGTHQVRKYVSVTVSPGGLGKSSLIITESLAMVTGRPLLGLKPLRPLRVWIWNGEDSRDLLDRRIMAACLRYNISAADIGGRLFVDTGREQELVIVTEDKRTGLKIIEPIVTAVIAQIKKNRIDVMSVDPFVSTHGVSENDNGAIDRVAKLWGKIADECDCAIEIVHHVRKVQDREVTVEDARGAVSLLAAARTARVLNRMAEDQAAKAGVSDEDRFSIFAVQIGKTNLSPMSSGSEWRRLESVALGNGRGIMQPQDHVGVVTQWQWPAKDAAVEAVTPDQLRAIKVRVANATCRESDQAGDWVGLIVAEALGVSVPPGRKSNPEKQRIKSMVDAWISEGMLETYMDRDARGEMKLFVRVRSEGDEE